MKKFFTATVTLSLCLLTLGSCDKAAKKLGSLFGSKEPVEQTQQFPEQQMPESYYGSPYKDYPILPTSGSITQFQWLSTQPLSHSELMRYTKADLRILRNAIFAMHGYRFKSPDLQIYFGNFYDYIPVTSKTPYLTRLELDNIALIKRYE